MKKDLDSRNFEKARVVSTTSSFARAKIGCIAVASGKVLSVGVNSYKTHPIQMKYDRKRNLDVSGNCASLHAMHAETACLVPLEKRDNLDWGRVEIYIYRTKKDNLGNEMLGMARPCKACMALLKDKGIKKIHYTTDDGFCDETLV